MSPATFAQAEALLRRQPPEAGELPPEEELREAAQRSVEAWRTVPGRAERKRTSRQAERLRRRLTEQIAALRRRGRAEPLSTGPRALLDNSRLLLVAAREAAEIFRAADDLPEIQSGDGRAVRAVAAAEAYLDATGGRFEAAAFVAFLNGAQSAAAWPMHELWALRPALQLSLARRASELFDSEADAETAELVASLHTLDQTPWKELFESLSAVHRTLTEEPSGVYARMDYGSREMYRKAVGRLARRAGHPEQMVARQAAALAAEAMREPQVDPRVSSRRGHVGYYLVDRGQGRLERALGLRAGLRGRFGRWIRNRATPLYLVTIELLAVALLVFVLAGVDVVAPMSWAAVLLLLLPALDAAVGVTNRLITTVLPPKTLPKLDFSESVPDDCATMVIVPTLLLNEEQVRDMAAQLEIRYLANRQPNLYFALLTDTPDSSQPFDESDELVNLAVELIGDLNSRRSGQDAGVFFLFHRHRVFNASEGSWMGWERKRGKILDFNRLLRGEHDSFPVKCGDLSVLTRIRYVITVDSDTQLPKDAAHRLIGAIAHPLNRAVIDPRTSTVVEGYAVLQPRVGVSVNSAARSRLAAIFSGETGFDIYTQAVSEVYQDLFGEGTFTGKGIYEVEPFERAVGRRFPANALLSHDLIEGVHARTGLVSDIELVDDYPSHFSAYSRRKHRWARGDWQIMRWLAPRVPNSEGLLERNPLSLLSRWKIVDNLRRSLTEPAFFALLLGGWFFLPGQPLLWTLAALVLLMVPSYMELLVAAARTPFVRRRRLYWSQILDGFVVSQVNLFFALAFLPHQTLAMLDAVGRTLLRMMVTRKKLLEWETAAQAESGARRRTPVDRYLDWTPWLTLAVAAALALARPEALLPAAPILALWLTLKPMCRWLNRPLREPAASLSPADLADLRRAGLLTWSYFRDHSGPEENWLVPDNIQEAPDLKAHRLSPTNLGMLLNSRLAASELGHLTLPEALDATAATLATINRLERVNGHFYNWYDTRTLQPLPPLFLSTVDNGNLVGSLWALKQALAEAPSRPLFTSAWSSLLDHALAVKEAARAEQGPAPLLALADELVQMTTVLERERSSWTELPELRRRAERLAAEATAGEARRWALSLVERAAALEAAVQRLTPWLIAADIERPKDLTQTPSLEDLSELSEYAVAPLADVRSEARRLLEQAEALAAQADRLAQEMDFALLYDGRRKLLSVGYDVLGQRLERSCYDLLASEARMAGLVAVAKADIPLESWFRLGRAHVRASGERVLLSWTGTMFEYLMPLLWMRPYPNTVVATSAAAAVRLQQKRALQLKRPWGVSEAAYACRDEQGCYLYQAFGVPAVALKEAAVGEQVVSPYATFLALPVDPRGALANLREMERRGWKGRHGFFEAVDFYARPEGEIVRCWMAHHQGMSLLAVTNAVCGGPFQRWFHAEPAIAAVERLLHEKAPAAMEVEAVTEKERQPEQRPALAPSAA